MILKFSEMNLSEALAFFQNQALDSKASECIVVFNVHSYPCSRGINTVSNRYIWKEEL